MPKTPKPILLSPRRCKYCKVNFVPVCRNEQQRTNAEAQIFCSADHRKAYHHSGGLNFEQLIEKAAKKIKAALLADKEFIEAIMQASRPPAREFIDALKKKALEASRPDETSQRLSL